ncbi:MmpS family transport accessory protein [Nocardia sp. NPDC019395]|uniref:MmpS family transport accessory protein n=1 Tax=Nocardia sp. NPDC019395 TaxID=3154686 RepID=UPI0033E82DC9
MSNPSGDRPQYPSAPQGEYAPAGTSARGYYQLRKRPRWPWIAGGIVAVFVLVVAGCIAVFANPADESISGEVAVTYQVEGSGTDASVAYLGRDQDMTEETAVTLPWKKDVTIGGWGEMVSLTASNGDAGGDITCRITVGGKVMSEQTSSGPHASASCSGDVGEQ